MATHLLTLLIEIPRYIHEATRTYSPFSHPTHPTQTTDGVMGLRVGFIHINNMYNNDVGKGVVYAYEAYEVK